MWGLKGCGGRGRGRGRDRAHVRLRMMAEKIMESSGARALMIWLTKRPMIISDALLHVMLTVVHSDRLNASHLRRGVWVGMGGNHTHVWERPPCPIPPSLSLASPHVPRAVPWFDACVVTCRS